MFKFRKIFEDIAEKAAEQIIKDALTELEQEKVIPAILIPIIDIAINIIDADLPITGITPSDK